VAEGLKSNQVITELNIADNNLANSGTDMSGVGALADVIPGMRALTSLHVGENRIPEQEMREIMTIAMRMDSMKILCEVPFKDKTITKLDVSGKNLGLEGALVVAEYLDGNGALSKLDASANGMFGCGDKTGVTAWAAALKASTSITELKNDIDADDVKILAPAISDNGAMTSLTFGDKQVFTMTAEMTEANFSGKLNKSYEAQIVWAFLPKCT
jgi:hypothetical protein